MSKIGSPTWLILRDEIRAALSSYEIHYNKLNDIPIALTLDEGSKKIEHKEFVAMGFVRIYIKSQGQSNVVFNKTHGFRHKQEANKEDWKLKLYRELMYELSGTAITHLFMLRELQEKLKDNENEG